jgi:hypothetical protein
MFVVPLDPSADLQAQSSFGGTVYVQQWPVTGNFIVPMPVDKDCNGWSWFQNPQQNTAAPFQVTPNGVQAPLQQPTVPAPPVQWTVSWQPAQASNIVQPWPSHTEALCALEPDVSPADRKDCLEHLAEDAVDVDDKAAKMIFVHDSSGVLRQIAQCTSTGALIEVNGDDESDLEQTEAVTDLPIDEVSSLNGSSSLSRRRNAASEASSEPSEPSGHRSKSAERRLRDLQELSTGGPRQRRWNARASAQISTPPCPSDKDSWANGNSASTASKLQTHKQPVNNQNLHKDFKERDEQRNHHSWIQWEQTDDIYHKNNINKQDSLSQYMEDGRSIQNNPTTHQQTRQRGRRFIQPEHQEQSKGNSNQGTISRTYPKHGKDRPSTSHPDQTIKQSDQVNAQSINHINHTCKRSSTQQTQQLPDTATSRKDQGTLSTTPPMQSSRKQICLPDQIRVLQRPPAHPSTGSSTLATPNLDRVMLQRPPPPSAAPPPAPHKESSRKPITGSDPGTALAVARLILHNVYRHVAEFGEVSPCEVPSSVPVPVPSVQGHSKRISLATPPLQKKRQVQRIVQVPPTPAAPSRKVPERRKKNKETEDSLKSSLNLLHSIVDTVRLRISRCCSGILRFLQGTRNTFKMVTAATPGGTPTLVVAGLFGVLALWLAQLPIDEGRGRPAVWMYSDGRTGYARGYPEWSPPFVGRRGRQEEGYPEWSPPFVGRRGRQEEGKARSSPWHQEPRSNGERRGLFLDEDELASIFMVSPSSGSASQAGASSKRSKGSSSKRKLSERERAYLDALEEYLEKMAGRHIETSDGSSSKSSKQGKKSASKAADKNSISAKEWKQYLSRHGLDIMEEMMGSQALMSTLSHLADRQYMRALSFGQEHDNL